MSLLLPSKYVASYSSLSYVLRKWACKEYGMLLEVWSKEHGKLKVFKKHMSKADQRCLQAFIPLEINWTGYQDLKSLKKVEALEPACRLSINGVLCGLYLNELLVRLLEYQVAYPNLFDLYEKTLSLLSVAKTKFDSELPLRRFELALLAVTGYSLEHIDLEDETDYYFSDTEGFTTCLQGIGDLASERIKGSKWKKLLSGDFSDLQSVKLVKPVLQYHLARQVAPYTLRTKELAIAFKHLQTSKEKLCKHV